MNKILCQKCIKPDICEDCGDVVGPIKRPPRNWRKDGFAYVGHWLQGFVVGMILPVIGWLFMFLGYQCTEFVAYWLRNSVHQFRAHDNVSRDISDGLNGYWFGSVVGISFWMWIFWHRIMILLGVT